MHKVGTMGRKLYSNAIRGPTSTMFPPYIKHALKANIESTTVDQEREVFS